MWWQFHHFYLHNRPHQWEQPLELGGKQIVRAWFTDEIKNNKCLYPPLTSIPGFDLEWGDAGLSRAIFVGGDDPKLILHPGVQACHLCLLHTAIQNWRGCRNQACCVKCTTKYLEYLKSRPCTVVFFYKHASEISIIYIIMRQIQFLWEICLGFFIIIILS